MRTSNSSDIRLIILAATLVFVVVVTIVWLVTNLGGSLSTSTLDDGIKAGARNGLWQDATRFEALTPFTIDLRQSVVSCPSIGTNAYLRWGNRLEGFGLRMSKRLPSVVRIHRIETGFHVYVIDRYSHTCTQEVVFATLEQAKRAADGRTGVRAPDEWQTLADDIDWLQVPFVKSE